MMIKDLFVKPIDRDIKGVIKVGQDDSSNVRQELEEYVVTRELQKHFAEFFSSYKRGILGTTDKMGVWISGFFGSGKSHFLKILSYLRYQEDRRGFSESEIYHFLITEKLMVRQQSTILSMIRKSLITLFWRICGLRQMFRPMLFCLISTPRVRQAESSPRMPSCPYS